MSDAPVPKRRRWPRRLLFALLLLAIAVVGGRLWLGSVAGARLESELALVREAGQPLLLSEVAPPPVPAADNAAPLLLEVRRLLVEEPDSIIMGEDSIVYTEETPFGASDAFYGKLAAWVEQNEPALEKAREAGARPACRFDLDWERGVEMDFPQVAILQALSRLLLARAVLQVRAGDVDGAVASCARIVRLAELGLREELWVHLLVRCGMVDYALVTAQQVLDRGRATGAALENLLSRLDGLPGDEALHQAFVNERAFGYDAFDRVRKDPAKMKQWTDTGFELGLGRDVLFHLVPGTMLDFDAARYLALMRRAVDLSGRPWLEARSDWNALGNEMNERPWYGLLTSSALGVAPVVARKWTWTQARLDLARLGLEIELQSRRKGAVPATLADLEAPRRTQDRFRDAPYVFRSTGDGGWILYSVGPDGKDDGGAPFDDDEHGDLVWRHVAHEGDEGPR